MSREGDQDLINGLAAMEHALANLVSNLPTDDLDQVARILRLVTKKEIIMEFLLEEINEANEQDSYCS